MRGRTRVINLLMLFSGVSESNGVTSVAFSIGTVTGGKTSVNRSSLKDYGFKSVRRSSNRLSSSARKYSKVGCIGYFCVFSGVTRSVLRTTVGTIGPHASWLRKS